MLIALLKQYFSILNAVFSYFSHVAAIVIWE